MSTSTSPPPTIPALPDPAMLPEGRRRAAKRLSNAALQYKKFSHAQIAEKVHKRHTMTEYKTLLMACAVKQDEEGIVFDTLGEPWKKLVEKCEEADRQQQQLQQQEQKEANTSSSTSNTSGTNTSSTNTSTVNGSNIIINTSSVTFSPSGVLSPVNTNLGSPTPLSLHTNSTMPEAPSVFSPSSAPPPSLVSPPSSRSLTSSFMNRVKSAQPTSASSPTSTVTSPLASSSSFTFSLADAEKDWVKINTSPSNKQETKHISPIHRRFSRSSSVSSTTGMPTLTHSSSTTFTQTASSSRIRTESFMWEDLEFEKKINRYRHESDSDMKTRMLKEREEEAEREGKKRDKIIDRQRAEEALNVIITQMNRDPMEVIDVNQLREACLVVGVPIKYRGRIWSLMLKYAQIKHAALLQSTAASKMRRSPRTSPTSTHSPISPPLSSQDMPAAAPRASSSSPTTPSASVSAPSSSATATATVLDQTIKLDLYNQRVIKADVDRTLSHLVTFQNAQVKLDMETILTQYCKENRTSYKQGMNFLLAPLFFLHLPSTIDVLNLFSGFVSILLPNTFSDHEFGALQCVFAIFHLLILYHDPELCKRLDANDMRVELFSTSWFITLFSNKTKLEVLYTIWDHLILEASHGDRCLSYFLCVALLINYRHSIMKEKSEQLPELLSKLTLHNTIEVKHLMEKAKRVYRAQTCQTLYDRLCDVTSRTISPDSLDYLQLISLPCISVKAEEVIRQLYNSPTTASTVAAAAAAAAANMPPIGSALKYFILDCRSTNQYRVGHLPMSYHLSPDLLSQPEQFEMKIEGLYAMQGCHLCLMSATGNEHSHADRDGIVMMDQPINLFILFLIKRGFKYVSVLEGGFAACHALILQQHTTSSGVKMELIDHDAENCMECVTLQLNAAPRKPYMQQPLQHPSHHSSTALVAPITTATTASAAVAAAAALPALTMNGLMQGVRHMTDSVMKAAGVTEQQQMEDYSDQHKATHLPNTTIQHNATIYTRLLHTILRDCKSDVAAFVSAVHQLSQVVLTHALDRYPTHIHDKLVHTAQMGGYIGISFSIPLIAVALSVTAEHILRHCLQPLHSVAPTSIGRVLLTADKLFDRIDIPHSLRSKQPIVLFHPVLSCAHQLLLMECIEWLLQLSSLSSQPSSKSSSSSNKSQPQSSSSSPSSPVAQLSQITVVCVIMSRTLLWRLSSRYPALCVVCSAVDEEVNDGKHNGQLVPGVVELDERYYANRYMHKTGHANNGNPSS